MAARQKKPVPKWKRGKSIAKLKYFAGTLWASVNKEGRSPVELSKAALSKKATYSTEQFGAETMNLRVSIWAYIDADRFPRGDTSGHLEFVGEKIRLKYWAPGVAAIASARALRARATDRHPWRLGVDHSQLIR